MEEKFDLSEYMSSGIENIVKNIVKASLKNPKETAFVMKYMLASKEAQRKRTLLSNKGQDIPPFLISSITSRCNLFCKGCYARANKSCGENLDINQLSTERWGEIFRESGDLGVSFILLAGGEPLMRKDVMEEAAKVKEVIFPIFTNGTIIDNNYVKLFDSNRNLIPMISIEGNEEQTDKRRGKGTYNSIIKVMKTLKEKGILFGASITVTTENTEIVTSKTFFDELYRLGCKGIIFVEYVPVTEVTKELAPTDKERVILENNQEQLRKEYEDAIFLSFPGDEKYTGGCLAAGRGFFHISVNGGAEPCPFSPYSDTNIKDCTLLEALQSPLFKRLKETGMLLGEHAGGCLLFEKELQVKGLLDNCS
ncbi:radical SAM protein [Clostridium sp. YIM B02515]|uniref:Radical SAM protein n=1 Tax=Clostridium rhizosphaerae TaxID=2803861 RepID=A0ABS1T8J4_9CLOT|nr:radical SAM protein [Clostridium rhizosphaerae]MBL4934684.1 radical SAM protein [Clostridium rhizosphaerae]